MLEHVDRPDPVVGPGQALVEVVFAGVNFMDIDVRQGVAWTETPNPKILGVEGVGRVLSVDEGILRHGTYAERIAAVAHYFGRKPKNAYQSVVRHIKLSKVKRLQIRPPRP